MPIFVSYRQILQFWGTFATCKHRFQPSLDSMIRYIEACLSCFTHYQLLWKMLIVTTLLQNILQPIAKLLVAVTIFRFDVKSGTFLARCARRRLSGIAQSHYYRTISMNRALNLLIIGCFIHSIFVERLVFVFV